MNGWPHCLTNSRLFRQCTIFNVGALTSHLLRSRIRNLTVISDSLATILFYYASSEQINKSAVSEMLPHLIRKRIIVHFLMAHRSLYVGLKVASEMIFRCTLLPRIPCLLLFVIWHRRQKQGLVQIEATRLQTHTHACLQTLKFKRLYATQIEKSECRGAEYI